MDRADGGPTVFGNEGWSISPDGSRVVYLTDSAGTEEVRLDSVPIAGPASASALLTWPALDAARAEMTPNSRFLLCHLDVEPVGGDEVAVYRTPLDGDLGDTIKLSGTEHPHPDLEVSPSSTRVAYEAGARAIFSVPISGSGTRYNLTSSLDAAFVYAGAITPDSQRIV